MGNDPIFDMLIVWNLLLMFTGGCMLIHWGCLILMNRHQELVAYTKMVQTLTELFD